MYQFSGRTDSFDFFDPNLPKKGFWGQNFEILSLESESAPSIYHECQFADKTNNFEIFGLNLGKLPNYVRYFGSYNVESVAESWVEVDRTGWRWMEPGGDGWSWVELGGGGWRWVKLGAQFGNTRF